MEQNFLQLFNQYWQVHFAELNPSGSRLIVAVSGGVDSIVLTYVLHGLGFDFLIAHCNFHLRGEESNRDENFVKRFAESIGKEIVCIDFDTIHYAKEKKIGVEEAARELRYSWFRQLADDYKIEGKPLPILVAHHANDNIETVLMNFFRGCGIAGLHGILPVNNGIYRPLLFAKRKDIVSYALSQKLNWVEDSTNSEEKYARNFLRNSIIPELKENYPTIEDNLLANIHRFTDVEKIYNKHISLIKSLLCKKTNDTYIVDIEKLKTETSFQTILFEIFKDFGFSSNQTNELVKLLDADSGAKIESISHIVWKDRSTLIISDKETSASEDFIFEREDSIVQLTDGSKISRENIQNVATNDTVILDMEKLNFPLKIRRWKEGDVFYPKGMQGKKKLAKYFIDLKIPTPIKHQIWLVTSNEEIVWIAGYRADRRFTASDRTIHSIQLSFIK
ncbi:MAG: tRNA lysidine(34) synthetase TilS [Pseudopedobacter saltans]|uniref:tRNA(Ile)-lysidine synthase n=1 Tax=Pseudopedobacter saltans TaxID=151895 RepID=A0A2W5FAU7_9SPHI|nr:MAG: tRNA lysidine(34) synthetase TilS [Pseudopedobacter saltans]